MVRAGIRARQIRPGLDAKKLATLIISSLEGAIMVYRLERTEESLRAVQTHLENYLESEVRARSKEKPRLTCLEDVPSRKTQSE